MPYIQRNEIVTPPDETVIWRYFRLEYFKQAIESNTLYFSPIYKFADPWEASIPKAGLEWRRKQLIDAGKKGKDALDKAIENVLKIEGIRQQSTRAVKANCWHMGYHESEAMWKLFVGTGDGVAIKSTVGHIKEALSEADEDIFIGQINYINYNDANFNDVQWYRYCFHKREAFSHEKEMRLAFFDINEYRSSNPNAAGRFVSTDLKHLILEIKVSANREDLIKEVISATKKTAIVVSPALTELSMPPINALSLFTFIKNSI